MNFLDKVIEHKRKEVEARKAVLSLDKLKILVSEMKPDRRSFEKIFKEGKGVICEIKPKSPSKGQLILGDIISVANIYGNSSADAISVLTDEEFFGGKLENLKIVREIVSQTILQKDFIIDEYQIYETAFYGADAYLLIVAALSKDKLEKFLKIGKELNLGVLVEVHTEGELKTALEISSPLIGVNNRDLESLEVHLERTEELSHLIPKEVPFISESGIYTPQDVARVRSVGARGLLIGTSILESKNPLELISNFKSELSK